MTLPDAIRPRISRIGTSTTSVSSSPSDTTRSTWRTFSARNEKQMLPWIAGFGCTLPSATIASESKPVSSIISRRAACIGDWILGIDHSARYLEREFRNPVTPLANHHDVAVFRERNDIHPVGRVEDEEVALAAPRMRRAASMEIENRRAVCDVALERLPLARLHLTGMLADFTFARIRLRRRDRRAMRSAAAARSRPTRGWRRAFAALRRRQDGT